MSDLVRELGCDWHTINDTVVAYGEALVDDPARIGDVEAGSLDETLFARVGRWRTQAWSTSIVDVGAGQLLDVIPGRSAASLGPARDARQAGTAHQQLHGLAAHLDAVAQGELGVHAPSAVHAPHIGMDDPDGVGELGVADRTW